MVALALLLPLGALAAGPFTDLNPGSGHNPNIQAIADAGITRGCNPPDFTQYCPNATVTREEMASFLARAAGLGANPPVANAKTAQSAQTAVSAQTATNATNAGNANTVGGYAPGGLVRAAGGRASSIAFGSNTQTEITRATLEAPTAGYVIAVASATLNVPLGQGGACPCGARAIISGPNATYSQYAPFSSATGESASSAATTVFVVQPGTVNIIVQMQRTAGTKNLTGDSDLSILYFPFGAGGATP